MNLINQNKVYRTAQEYNWITVAVPGAGLIEGALQEQISYSVEANYNTIFSLDSYFNSLDSVATLATETSLFRTGLFTKRFWKGGGYLRINPKFRIVDHAGDGSVVAKATILLNSALPQANLTGIADTLAGTVTRIQASSRPEGISEEQTSSISTPLAIGSGILVAGATGSVRAGVIAGVATKLLADPDSLRELVEGVSSNQPKPVIVNVSNYFEKAFVTENVNVTFSQEMIETKEGNISPMYADFDCLFGTQEVTTFGNTGLSTNKGRFRVEQ